MNGKRYDLIFSLGEACSCSQTLRNCNLQFKSYPFDWLFGSSFSKRIDLLVNDFDRFIDKEDLEFFYSEKSIKCDAYKNLYNELVFNHDFPTGVNINDSYDKIREKYDRRITRLLKKIDEVNSILIVYIETPNHKTFLTDDILIEGYNKLVNKFKKNISLLCLSNDTNYQAKQINQNIKRIYLNYKKTEDPATAFFANFKILNKELKSYKLNISFFFPLRAKILRFISYFIIIKSSREKFRQKYHVRREE